MTAPSWQQFPSSSSPPRPGVGQIFDPSRQRCGFYPPDIVARCTDLTDGEKRLYERAVRWAGTNSTFWYGFDRMALELGKSRRQVMRDMAKLERCGLILPERRRGRRSNKYRFLYHPMFDADVTPTSHQRPKADVTDSPSDVTSVPPADVTPTSSESCKKNLVRESSSALVEVPPEGQPAEPTDDDSPSEKDKPKTNTPVGESQLAKAEANSEADTQPATEGLGAESGTGAAAPNPGRKALIATARQQLRMARAQGLGISLEQIGSPDPSITVQILEAFRTYDDFQEWLKDTVRRGLATKARDSRWGLYLRDADNHAEDIALRREAKAKRRIDDEIAYKRQQAAEAAAVAELDIAVPATQAYCRILIRVEGRGVPRPLKARLERTGELISPNELARQMSDWKRCSECKDRGMVGCAINHDLRFCACPAGIEAQQSPSGRELEKPEAERFHKGADYCRLMIEHKPST